MDDSEKKKGKKCKKTKEMNLKTETKQKSLNISEPYPLGIESLLGSSTATLRKGTNGHRKLNSQYLSQARSGAGLSRCVSERNFRSIIKLNESLDSSDQRQQFRRFKPVSTLSTSSVNPFRNNEKYRYDFNDDSNDDDNSELDSISYNNQRSFQSDYGNRYRDVIYTNYPPNRQQMINGNNNNNNRQLFRSELNLSSATGTGPGSMTGSSTLSAASLATTASTISMLGVSRQRLLNSRSKMPTNHFYQQKRYDNQNTHSDDYHQTLINKNNIHPMPNKMSSCSSSSISSSMSRQPMVTFTLPRSFKPKYPNQQPNYLNLNKNSKSFQYRNYSSTDNDETSNQYDENEFEEDTEEDMDNYHRLCNNQLIADQLTSTTEYEETESEDNDYRFLDEYDQNDDPDDEDDEIDLYPLDCHLSTRSKLNERYFTANNGRQTGRNYYIRT